MTGKEVDHNILQQSSGDAVIRGAGVAYGWVRGTLQEPLRLTKCDPTTVLFWVVWNMTGKEVDHNILQQSSGDAIIRGAGCAYGWNKGDLVGAVTLTKCDQQPSCFGYG
ncbi:hypothetical protein CEXT_443241 [Caerostris extrusa]|uniref:Uncharacterized protein n=1 Tax=Caerostris extrusa TaxID=172846 RepID=A0AAV4RAX5_CAEEX|nr:hypothetical protein CEXT_443241 [Caerostris extrusa]